MKNKGLSAAACAMCVAAAVISSGCDINDYIRINNSGGTVNIDIGISSAAAETENSEKPETEIKPEGATEPALNVGGEYTVSGVKGYLPVKSEPSKDDGDELVQLHNGDLVVVITNKTYGENDEYWFVKVAKGSDEGKAGYVNKYYLTANGTNSESSKQESSSNAASSKQESSSNAASSKQESSSKAASSKQESSSKAASSKQESSSKAASSKQEEASSVQPEQPQETVSSAQINDTPILIEEKPTPSEEESVSSEESVQENLFEILPESFSFLSGVGNWSSSIKLNSDGSFTGSYADVNMGETGAGYPNGTVYYCDFSGTFGNVKKIDDYTYTMELLSLTQEKEAETEEIKDNVRYVYSYPYGLKDGRIFEVYLPGKPTSEISTECLSWLMHIRDKDYLPDGYYALCQDNDQFGWFSS